MYDGTTPTSECNLWPINAGLGTNRPVFLETADVTGTEVTTITREVTIITITSVTDIGNTYFYMYITIGNEIDKVTYLT